MRAWLSTVRAFQGKPTDKGRGTTSVRPHGVRSRRMAAFVFLARDAASCITGQVIALNDGTPGRGVSNE